MGQTLALILLLVCGPALAVDVKTYIPAQAHALAPELVEVQVKTWPDAYQPWTMAGQVEQESCITLTHKRCWNPGAELKTSREWGVGLGQVTIAYRADGSVRFNKFEELKAQHASLRDWKWEDRYNASYQLMAIVEMDRALFGQVRDAASADDRLAFMLAGYNGGQSGVLQDRRLCANTPRCNSRKWFGHVEQTSLKTRQVNAGYGKSAFEINREYVNLILNVRRIKYRQFWGL